MKHICTAAKVHQLLAERTDVDILRIWYCYQIGSTFIGVSLMEDTIINAMTMCNRIKVESVLKKDAEAWRRLTEKMSALQNSTLGTLITILSRHSISADDIAYLKWIKVKRDFFVHRLFRQNYWPGDLSEESFCSHNRRLLYLQAIFNRASHRIWLIFERANLLDVIDLGVAGRLMQNKELWDETLTWST